MNTTCSTMHYFLQSSLLIIAKTDIAETDFTLFKNSFFSSEDVSSLSHTYSPLGTDWSTKDVVNSIVLKTSSGDKYLAIDIKRDIESYKKSLDDIRSQVKDAYQSIDIITSINVTFEGTWLTRAHLSQTGVGCVISICMGFAIDYKIMSKCCIECEYAKSE
ncbi:hypothetical protein NPIL_41561 [Nephila pilipes]|uniref:Mutator-like transposase domain-containing protein n=1 Tax=Nephila pilipes TaxID=299642 RepID=A0A8X6Q649_NEPPI|nr:hypothetical protein NPIL_41561 [Nephila pilipes]